MEGAMKSWAMARSPSAGRGSGRRVDVGGSPGDRGASKAKLRIYRNAQRFAACDATGTRTGVAEPRRPREEDRAGRPRRGGAGLSAAGLGLLALAVACPTALSADLAREGRIAAEIAGGVREGEIRRLKAGDSDFLAIDTLSKTAETRGAVVLLHDRGMHPDWPDVIRPLRLGLPGTGWRTLAIQLPVGAADAPDAAHEALVGEAGPRIAAAVAFLREGPAPLPVAVVAHGLGARMAATHLATAPADSIQAVVVIGLPGGASEADALGKPGVPVLDLYGSRDLDAARSAAPARLQTARRGGNAAYQQVEIAGADHAFTGMSDTLVSRVRAWLHRVLRRDGAFTVRPEPPVSP
jgi:hypothetical protein